MQTRMYLALALAVTLLIGQSSVYGQVPLGSEFTYQGQLKDGGIPANGDYDFVFRLFDDPNSGAQIGSDFPVDDWPVTDGLFTVLLDFGAGAFTSDARWLEVAVRPGADINPHTVLTPRQPVTAAPVALYALDGPGATGLWEAVGNNIVNTNAGFVGVGRSTPIVPSTEFFGVLTPTGDNAYGGMHIQTEGESGWPYYGYSTASGIKAWTYFDTGANKWHLYAAGKRLTVDRSTGNVGIGTETPQAKLHVAGTAQMDGFQLTGSPSAGYVLTSDANGVGTWQPSGGGSGFWSANGDHIYNTNSGFVGIGTMDPASMLDVQSAEGTHGIMSAVPWIPVWAHRTGTSGTWPAVHGECDSEDPDGSALRGIMTSSSSGSSSAGVRGINSGSGYGVYGSSTGGSGVLGEADAEWSTGVRGINNGTGFGFGVYGVHYGSGWGAYGVSFESTGVRGDTHGDWYTAGVHGHSNGIFGYGVHGTTDAGGVGVNGYAPSGIGVAGTTDSVSANAIGVYGVVSSTTPGSSSAAVRGQNNGTGGSGIGVWGSQDGSGWGVYGYAPSGRGVYGLSAGGTGVRGHNSDSWSGQGVRGTHAGYGVGVFGESAGGFGVYAKSTSGDALYAEAPDGSYAARFIGNVRISSPSSGQTLIEFGEGLDYAEGFDVSDESEITPGAVLVIDAENAGELAISKAPYDHKVAGIVAGANGLGSAVRLGAGQFDFDVALAGRVYCNVDASYGAIQPGDLLTTSPTPGYAMKVTDREKSQGAILGKAMQPLEQGEQGQILVLVTLQ